MKKNLFLFALVIFAASCKILTGDNQGFAHPETAYKLGLNPAAGSAYYYDIVNTTETQVEIDGQEVENINKSTVGMSYHISKDSAGNLLFQVRYDKVQVYLKNGDSETAADAQNAKFSLNPVEKMLGVLKEAQLVATVSPTGEVKGISGYQELSEKLMAGLNPNDEAARKIARSHLDKIIGEGMIKGNLAKLFKMFPDSAVRLGDKWKISSTQNDQFNLDVTSFYQLKAINEEIVLIESESDLQSNPTPVALMGSVVTPNLKGTQVATYGVEAKSGMLLDGEVRSEVEGELQMMGRVVPIKLKASITLHGRKVR